MDISLFEESNKSYANIFIIIINYDKDFPDEMGISLSIIMIQGDFCNSTHSVISNVIYVPRFAKAFCQETRISLWSFLRFVCQVLLFTGTQMRGESHRTLLWLALIGTNYSVYVSRDRTNSRSQTQLCINPCLFDADIAEYFAE